MTALAVSKRAQRVAVACFFFIVGLSFASWASRIPDIKTRLGLNEAQLGGILFALPAGSMLSMPLSGWLVAKFGSRRIVIIAAICYPLMLIAIGLTVSVWQLVAVLIAFGLLGNMCNISINTQAVGVSRCTGVLSWLPFTGSGAWRDSVAPLSAHS
jgi:MFS family permease